MVKIEIWHVNMKFNPMCLTQLYYINLILWSSTRLNGEKCKNTWRMDKKARNDEYHNIWTILTTNCQVMNWILNFNLDTLFLILKFSTSNGYI